jgi:hypothetical protein
MYRSSKLFFSSGFPTKRATRHTHLIFLDLTTQITFGEQYIS